MKTSIPIESSRRVFSRVSFDALGDQVFADDRKELNGDHPFDQSQFQGASILVVNGNFGCGSSREHAPQALMRWGIRAVVGVSFAEIFFGNCLALGIPCVTAAPDQIQAIQATIQADPAQVWALDLAGSQPGPMLRSGRWDATSQLLDQQVDDLDEGAAVSQRLPTGLSPLLISPRFRDGWLRQRSLALMPALTPPGEDLEYAALSRSAADGWLVRQAGIPPLCRRQLPGICSPVDMSAVRRIRGSRLLEGRSS